MVNSSSFVKGFISLLFLVVIVSGFAVGQNESNGHRIEIAIDGWKDTISYMGYYIGAKTYIEDTASVKNGVVVFEGKKSLDPGMYFLYSPKSIFFEFLVNEDNFTLQSKQDEIIANMRIKGSRENELFFAYQNKMSGFQSKAGKLGERLKGLTGEDSIATLNELKSINTDVEQYQRYERGQYSGTFYSEILSLILRPGQIDAPAGMSAEGVNTFRFYRYKDLFWEGVDFQNPGTIRNPLFEGKVNEYFEKLVYSNPDSVTKEIDDLLSQKMDTTVFRYLVVSLTNRYATSKQMGMDAVYVYMIDNYYSSGKAYWIDETTLVRMQQNSDRLKPILIGEKAPLFKSETLSGSLVSDPFATTSKDFKIIFFYDSGCGHCKESIPKLMDSYNSLKTTGVSVDLITMNLSEDKVEWQKFVDDYAVEGQILGDTKGYSNAGYYYYVDSTPQIYIVDKNNEIIAKKISAEFVDEFIRDYIKFQ